MRAYVRILAAGWLMMIGMERAVAVPPPDFLFAVGSQLGIIFALSAIFFSSALAAVVTFARAFFGRIKHKKLFWSAVAILVVMISVSVSMYLDALWQQTQYEQWVEESAQNAPSEGVAVTDIEELDPTAEVRMVSSSSSAESSVMSEKIMAETSMPTDPNEDFIRQYYNDIGSGNLESAYAVSKKSVPFDTFQGWYENVTDVSVDTVQPVRWNVYSIVVRVKEGEQTTRYGVLMTLKQDDAGNTSIEQSTVKTLPSDEPPPVETTFEGTDNQVPADDPQFWNLPAAVGNAELQTILSHEQPFILDAREDEEFDIGRFPGSRHIRFADLLAGEWISLPADREIYVFCWSGIRGKEVADFLRSKNIRARYVEQGADGWVADGGTWDGGIKFLSRYTDERYQIVFSTAQVRSYVQDGVVLVDSRPQSVFAKRGIPGSVNIPVIYTPTSGMDEALNRVPAGATVITVCDDFVSCFDAKVAGVKLERRGHRFLGRYNKPWEYR